MRYVISLRNVTEECQVGVKVRDLLKLKDNGFSIPDGYAITKDLYDAYLARNNLQEFIGKALSNLEQDNCAKIAIEIEARFLSGTFSNSMQQEIMEAYQSLSFGRTDIRSMLKKTKIPVLVRNSPTTRAPFPHLHFLNILGTRQIMEAVKMCYASNFSEEALKSLGGKGHGSAIIIHPMIEADRSGLAYSIDPEGLSDYIVVQACFGMGETMLSPLFNPDSYYVDRNDLSVVNIEVREKGFSIIMDPLTGTTKKRILRELGKKQVLDYNQISEVARITKKITSLLDAEQMIEWCIRDDKIYIINTKEILLEQSAAPGERGMPATSNEEEHRGPASFKTEEFSTDPIQLLKHTHIQGGFILVNCAMALEQYIKRRYHEERGEIDLSLREMIIELDMPKPERIFGILLAKNAFLKKGKLPSESYVAQALRETREIIGG